MPRSFIDFQAKHHRRSVRLPGFDYRRSGMYFVTICAKNRESLFGDMENGEVKLNALGKIVEEEILHTPMVRPSVRIDSHVVMPNHIHIVVCINGGHDDGRGVLQYAPTRHVWEFHSPSQSLGAIVRGLKAAVTKRVKILYPTWDSSVWQRNYHERIIRNPSELRQFTQYIVENPRYWEKDEENVR